MLQRLFFFVFLFIISVASAQKKILGSYNPATKLFETEDKTYSIGFFTDGLVHITQNGYTGLMDSTGTVLIEPHYEKIYDFENNVARIVVHGKFGLTDKKGNIILEPFTPKLSAFVNGVAAYQNSAGSLYGLVSEKGKFITKPLYTYIKNVGYNRFAYEKDTVLGILTPQGKEIPLIKDRSFRRVANSPLHGYSEHYALHGKEGMSYLFEFQEGLTPFVQMKDLKWSAIDTNGREIIAPVYDELREFRGGFAKALQGDKWGVIDVSGKTRIPFMYRLVKPAAEGKFVVTTDSLYGLRDVNGNILLENKYKGLHYLFDNLYAITNGKHWGVIDEKGKEILPCEYDAVISAGKGKGIVCWNTGNIPLDTGVPRYIYVGEYTYFDRNGKSGAKNYPFSNTIEQLGEEYIVGKENEHAARYYAPMLQSYTGIPLSVTEGMEIGGIHYDYANRVKGGYTIVGKSTEKIRSGWPFYDNQLIGKFGITDPAGKIIVPLVYDGISNEGKPVFVVKQGEKYGLINLKNELIFPVEYPKLELISTGVIVYKKDERQNWIRAIYDYSGKELLPFQSWELSEIETTGQWLKGRSTADYIDRKGNSLVR